MAQRINKKLLIIILVLALVGFFSFMFYRNMTFRLVSTNAVGNTFSTSSNQLVLSFNQNISSNFDTSRNNITVDPKIIAGQSKVVDNQIIIDIYNTYDYKEFEVTINKIDSQDGKSINNFHKKFDIKYIDYGQLSKEEQARQNSQSDSGENQFPIINELPIYTDEYVIDYALPDETSDQKLIIKIDVLGVPSTLAMAAEHKDYLDQIRAKALDSLTSKGYDINQYKIEYSEPTLEPGQVPELPPNSD